MQKTRVADTATAPQLRERFKSYISTTATGCWSWTGATHQPNKAVPSRYGRFRMGTRVEEAHRAAYLLFVGGIPADLTVDHLCRNTLCVNPQHLELVSQAENTRRANTKAVCRRGHLRTPGSRRCAVCLDIWKQRQRATAHVEGEAACV